MLLICPIRSCNAAGSINAKNLNFFSLTLKLLNEYSLSHTVRPLFSSSQVNILLNHTLFYNIFHITWKLILATSKQPKTPSSSLKLVALTASRGSPTASHTKLLLLYLALYFVLKSTRLVLSAGRTICHGVQVGTKVGF